MIQEITGRFLAENVKFPWKFLEDSLLAMKEDIKGKVRKNNLKAAAVEVVSVSFQICFEDKGQIGEKLGEKTTALKTKQHNKKKKPI